VDHDHLVVCGKGEHCEWILWRTAGSKILQDDHDDGDCNDEEGCE
jgi:hypothetical protein